MTSDEAYAVFGVSDPIKQGATYAETIWGVDGIPLSVAKRLVEQVADTLTAMIEQRGGAPLAGSYAGVFTTAAKPRLFDLYMAALHFEGTA